MSDSAYIDLKNTSVCLFIFMWLIQTTHETMPTTKTLENMILVSVDQSTLYFALKHNMIDVQRELEVDPRTGMKNYIANESGGWATSTNYIRQSLLKAIELRRRARSDADLYEALRLLGQALHTLEDLPAHSNWVELALIEMGYRNVFPHVGENTAIRVGGKTIYPLVTGTFGGMDFIHSLLGYDSWKRSSNGREASDHLSQTQISDVNAAVTNASAQGGNSAFTMLTTLFAELPGHQGKNLLSEMQRIQATASKQTSNIQTASNSVGTSSSFYLQSGDFDPEKIAQEIYPILEFRDRVVKFINNTIDKVCSPLLPPWPHDLIDVDSRIDCACPKD
jgi:hypothetical protein